MTDIIPGPLVTVVTNKATFSARKLVITAGAWAPSLVRKLGIQLPFKVGSKLMAIWTPVMILHTNSPATSNIPYKGIAHLHNSDIT